MLDYLYRKKSIVLIRIIKKKSSMWNYKKDISRLLRMLKKDKFTSLGQKNVLSNIPKAPMLK